MSQPAFFFDPNLCTGCAACAIACQIENQRLPEMGEINPPPWRTIYSRNPSNLPGLSGFHLTVACNHCLEPACLTACPAAAITKDSLTGAVLINPRRCIGCGYCAWACPFDAPKYNRAHGIMEKCTFCQPRLLNGSQPACTTACPTGALRLGLLSHDSPGTAAGMSGFPKTTMKPAARFEPLREVKPGHSEEALMILNDRPVEETKESHGKGSYLSNEILRSAQPGEQPTKTNPTWREISMKYEWPLMLLTVAMPALFAWFAGFPPERHAHLPWVDAAILFCGIFTLLVSSLHLGKPWRAWRAISNANTSWLSREILFVGAFLVMSGVAFGLTRIGTNDFLYRSAMLVQTSLLLVGSLALFSIDRVYAVLHIGAINPEDLYRPRLQLHSALALFGGYYLAGILALAGNQPDKPLQAILVTMGALFAALQLCLYANRHVAKEPATPSQALLRFTRVTAGFVLPGVLLAAGAPAWLPIALALVGFAIDRSEFYTSLRRFKPGW